MDNVLSNEILQNGHSPVFTSARPLLYKVYMGKMSDRLKQARRAKYRTAKEFAEKNGMNPSTYYHHESGRNDFDAETAQRYADILGVSAGWLLTGEPEMGAVETAMAFEPVPIIGKVEAGTWNGHEEVEIWEAEKVSLPADPRFTRNE